MAATLPFREALNKGITSGTLVDTKIILFSRRDSSGRVYGPKTLYASSHVLRTVPYFNDLLFGNFSEAELRNFDDDVEDHESTSDDYGYYSDSDLEDEKPTSSAIADDESGAFSSRQPPQENHSELDTKGKVVRILDVAFVTFQAFIFYLYTGQIEFAPLGSRSSKTIEAQTPSDGKIPQASSKSIYRLADKYDTPLLKDLALNHIRSEGKNCDIVKETFSKFTSRYDDIRMVCIPLLVSALQDDTPEKTTWTRFCEIVEGHFKGDLQHVTDTLSLLWKTVNQDGDSSSTIAFDGTPSPTNVNNSTSWNDLQTAMVKSIREGIFFDRQYWAQYSRKGSALKAIYFSSIITGDRLSPFSSTNDSVREVNTESDCESDSVETNDAQREDRNTRVALSTGSYSAWRSLFYYECTSHISFAPLRSQGTDSRLGYILEKTMADTPPPCSPKSIYILANLLNIEALRELAFKDIKSKLSAENIVEELFSPFSASNHLVRGMECGLLFSKFKNETTMSLVQERIRGVSGNNLAHRAVAFKLAVRTSLDLKKFSPQADMRECVALKCWSSSCIANKEHVLYSLVGSRDACPQCEQYFMQCASCMHIRRDSGSLCANCKKPFL